MTISLITAKIEIKDVEIIGEERSNGLGELIKLPNIGNALEQRLNQIGIYTIEDLQQKGSKESFKQVKAVDKEACLNMLCALEGALQGVRWHNLSQGDKKSLKEYYQSLKDETS
jgi:DNA transformation protein and related proteins